MAGKTFPLAVVLSAVDRVTAPFRKVTGEIERMGAKLSSIGKKLTTTVSAPIAALGGFAIKTGLDVDRSFNRIRGVTGASAEEMQQLQAAVRALPPDLGLTRGIEALEGLAEEGFGARDSLAALVPTALLAKVAAISGAEAAELEADALGAVGKEASDLPRLLDLVAKSTGGSSKLMREFLATLNVVGPGMRAANVPLEEQVAQIKALGSVIDGGLAGGALKKAIDQLLDPTTAMQQAFVRLGIAREQVLDDEGNLRPLAGLLELMRERSATAADYMEIFGRKAGVAFANLDPSVIVQARAELDGFEGALQRAAAAADEGAAGSWNRFRNSLTALMDQIAQSGLLELFGDVINVLNDLMAAFGRLDPSTKKMIVNVGLVAAAVGPMLIALGKAVAGVSSLVGGFAAAAPKIVAGFGAIKGAAVAFGAAIAATPIGWLIGILAALGVAIWALYENWDTVTEFLAAGWERMMLPVRLGLEYLMAMLPSLRELVPDWILNAAGVSSPSAAPGAAASSAAAVTAAAQVSGGVVTERAEASVNVRFQNLPAGASVSTERNDGVDLSLQQGYALGS